MSTTTTTQTPKELLDLHDYIIKTAKEFGYNEGKNALFRDCIINKNSGMVRSVKSDDANFWFGFVREDQGERGAYDGLSFVIFPEDKGKHCLVSIGIGSSSLGKDGDLASNPGFRRSFMRLIKKGKSDAKFFFKLRFDDMEISTPGLQEELYSEKNNYEDVLINTSTKYNADSSKEAPGLLPAAFIVDYTIEDGWKLIQAWLAQYTRWRCWDKFGTGSTKKSITTAIDAAIKECRSSLTCLTPDDIYKILKENKYVVLQGAPGCGKTWSANKVADSNNTNGDKLFAEVVFTQFHAETTYSDFVYGIRPTLNGTILAYKGEKGVLLKAIDKAIEVAKKDSNGKVLLIIDEINRANLANVLGPVFYLFEPNAARKHKLSIGTQWNEKEEKEEEITLEKLPDNLYVLATMNTADKSLAVVDFALRRRFAWVTLYPHELNIFNFDKELFDKVDNLFALYATDEELNLQPGQSYFMDKNNRKENIKFGLMPLMKEYFAEGFLLSAKEEFAQLFTSETGTYMYN